MSIPTQMSLVGFVASAPELHFSRSGTECCRVRIGVEQHRKEVNGSFTTLDPTFHDLVMFDRTAREAYERFRPGDSFIASGYVHEYEVTNAGGSLIKEEFVARKIGHDANKTHYDVTRRRPAATHPASQAANQAATEPAPPRRLQTPRLASEPAMDDYGGVDGGYAGEHTDNLGLPDGVPRPVNWNLLDAEEAEVEWRDLDLWVTWLKTTFGLPPAIVPPYWHRHDELIWELSALRTHFLTSFDPDASPSAPIGWMREFAEARHRLRDWVATCGTRLDRDRPTRQTPWPGEQSCPASGEVEIRDRAADFEAFLAEDILRRHRIAQVIAHRSAGA